ncbi:hypothetical protein EW146_g3866 [Bondarzewia mesenterica]|uniref:Uncharacterized protein n=1 Tax=Bondarzewia mesenterica TaxID=1095465 RepID=A0A4S4LXI8_9AGAM|nr:hypothetical protein EW146_g3866 [Bondarzewia mesenterica]
MSCSKLSPLSRSSSVRDKPRRFPGFRLAFRSAPTTRPADRPTDSHPEAPSAVQCNVSLPPPPPRHPPFLASLPSPYPAAPVVMSPEVQEPPWPLPRSPENLPALLGDIVTINGVPFNTNSTGIPCLDELLEISTFPETPEEASRLLAVVRKVREERLARKHRAQAVLKCMLIQTELWEEELEKAEAEWTQVIASFGVMGCDPGQSDMDPDGRTGPSGQRASAGHPDIPSGWDQRDHSEDVGWDSGTYIGDEWDES